MMGTPGHSYDIDVVIDDTIATIYVDWVALSARMYDRPSTEIAVQVVDGELTVEKAALSRLEVGVIGQPSTG
jgi:beta-fructofuranosidase